MKIVQMTSADGGAEIEVSDDRVEYFERKGWRVVDAKAPRSRSTKAQKADAREEN